MEEALPAKGKGDRLEKVVDGGDGIIVWAAVSKARHDVQKRLSFNQGRIRCVSYHHL